VYTGLPGQKTALKIASKIPASLSIYLRYCLLDLVDLLEFSMRNAWIFTALFLSISLPVNAEQEETVAAAAPKITPDTLEDFFKTGNEREALRILNGLKDSFKSKPWEERLVQLLQPAKNPPLTLLKNGIEVLVEWNSAESVPLIKLWLDKIDLPEPHVNVCMELVRADGAKNDQVRAREMLWEYRMAAGYRKIRALESLIALDSRKRWAKTEYDWHVRVTAWVDDTLLQGEPAQLDRLWPALSKADFREYATKAVTMVLDEKLDASMRLSAMRALQAIGRLEEYEKVEAQTLTGDLKTQWSALRPWLLTTRILQGTDAVAASAYDELKTMEDRWLPALKQARTWATKLPRMNWLTSLHAAHLLKVHGQAVLELEKWESPEFIQPHVFMKIAPTPKTLALRSRFSIEKGGLEYAAVSRNSDEAHESLLLIAGLPTHFWLGLAKAGFEPRGDANPKGDACALSVQWETTLYGPQGEEKRLVRVPIEALIERRSKDAGSGLDFHFWGSNGLKTAGGKFSVSADASGFVIALMDDPTAVVRSMRSDAAGVNMKGDSEPELSVQESLVNRPGLDCWLAVEPVK
jgi:hypothetical protein